MFYKICRQSIHIAPLSAFRVLFGMMMCVSIIRFIAKGWVYVFFIQPKMYFTYYGFEWVKPLPSSLIYLLFALLLISALGIALGLFYRISSVLFFLIFTYIELIDKTNYLNHYYFVSLISFIMIWLPAHHYFSVDVRWRDVPIYSHVPAWCIHIVFFQVSIVYFYAGVAKVNNDWLIHAMPLKIWLPRKGHWLLVGSLLDLPVTAYIFSWVGMLFDISIWVFFMIRYTRVWAYLVALIFHVFTSMLFQIGMFPFIMMTATLVFFSAAWHLRWMTWIYPKIPRMANTYAIQHKTIPIVIAIYIIIQLLIPMRYLIYPGHLFWTEEGYRFSWRVMLIEKEAMAEFSVRDSKTGKIVAVRNKEYLSDQQEKMVRTQPDMILQYAHKLRDVYKEKGFKDPIVKVESYAKLNGGSTQLYIDSSVNLSNVSDGFAHQDWIRRYNEK